MKKIVLGVVMMILSVGVFAQNKTQEKKIKYFVEAATKEFSLDAKQNKELLDARNTYISEFMDVQEQVKSGAISQEDKPKKMNEVNKKFNDVFSKITGKPVNELQAFFARMREELQNI